MASYRQFMASGKLKRMSWVCGVERILVEEVVQTIKDWIAPKDLDYVTMIGGLDKEKDVWGQLNQYPSEPGANRLLVVRDAERLKQWQRFDAWVSDMRLMPTNFVLFVSNETDFNTERSAHRTIVDKSGTMVRCNTPDEQVAVEWIQSQTPMHSDVARRILERCGGDLAKSKSAAAMCRLFPFEPTYQVVDAIVEPEIGALYVDSLVACNRREAASTAYAVPESDIGRTIGLLDSRLDVLEKLHRAARKGLTAREIATSRSVNPFLIHLLMPFAKLYDRESVQRRRQLLVVVDSKVRDGARVGVLESLAALW